MSAPDFPAIAPRIEGELVTLVQLDASFFEEVFAAVNEPETMRLTATKKSFTRAQILEWLQTRPGAPQRIDWAILHEGTYVGEVVLNEFNESKNSMNLRIALAGPAQFGRGFGSEAVALAVEYGLENLALRRITLSVLTDNARAIGTYEKVGFLPGREYSEGKHRFLRMSIDKFDRVRALAESKLAEHLDPRVWSFRWDNAKRRAGLCDYQDKAISISSYYAQVHSIDETLQVVLHEVAHAMVGHGEGHGKKWKDTAASIGYRADKFTGREIAESFAPWVGTCPKGHVLYRYRRPTSPLSCGRCSKTFSKANLIEWQSR